MHKLYLQRHWNWTQKGEGKTDALDQPRRKQIKKIHKTNWIPLKLKDAMQGFNTKHWWHNRNQNKIEEEEKRNTNSKSENYSGVVSCERRQVRLNSKTLNKGWAKIRVWASMCHSAIRCRILFCMQRLNNKMYYTKWCPISIYFTGNILKKFSKISFCCMLRKLFLIKFSCKIIIIL